MDEPESKREKIDESSPILSASSCLSQEPMDQTVPVGDLTIHNLNDDCLKCIFSWLSVTGRFAIQRVSHRWQTVVDEIFESSQHDLVLLGNVTPYRHTFTLINEPVPVVPQGQVPPNPPPPLPPAAVLQAAVSPTPIIHPMQYHNSITLPRTSPFLPISPLFDSNYLLFTKLTSIRVLTLKQLAPITPTMLHNFFERSPQLQSVVFSRCTFVNDKMGWKALKSLGKKLTTFVFGNNHMAKNDAVSIAAILEGTEKLNFVDIAQFSWPQTQCFLKHLPSSLENLSLNVYTLQQLESVAAGLKNLQSLSAEMTPGPTNSNPPPMSTIFDFDCVKDASKLTTLTLDFFSFPCAVDLRSSRKVLPQIKRLSILNTIFIRSTFEKLCSEAVNLEDFSVSYRIRCTCPSANADPANNPFGPYQFLFEFTPDTIDNNCQACSENFLQPLSCLSRLKRLSVKTHRAPHESGLVKVLNDGLLPNLRLLSPYPMAEAVADAFIKHANGIPKQSYYLLCTVRDYERYRDKFANLPRNVKVLEYGPAF